MIAVLVCTGIFILFDVVTGILKGLYNEGLNSTILRKGLFHKLSEVLAVIAGWLAEYGAKYVNIHIPIPLLSVVATYICIMEAISIIENLCEINPSLGKLFKPYLAKLKEEQDDINENSNNR